MAKSHLLMFFWLLHCPIVQSNLGAEQSKQEMGARALGLVPVGFSTVPRAHSADSDPGPASLSASEPLAVPTKHLPILC